MVGGLVGRVSEHDPLVARAFVLVARCIDTLGDMLRLRVELVDQLQRLPVKAVLLITDPLYGRANRRLDLVPGTVHPGPVFINALAADFARKHHQLGRGQRLAGNSRLGVLGEEQVDDRVADLVRDLVGVAFGNRFGGEEKGLAH